MRLIRLGFWSLRAAYLAGLLRRIETVDLAHPEAATVRSEYLQAVDRLRIAAGAHG